MTVSVIGSGHAFLFLKYSLNSNRLLKQYFMEKLIIYSGGDFMACEECTKCWFNYVEKCEGQEENYDEKVCKKKIIEKSQINKDE
jgi:hypothetical protein